MDRRGSAEQLTPRRAPDLQALPPLPARLGTQLHKLSLKKYRRASGLLPLEGVRLISDAFGSGQRFSFAVVRVSERAALSDLTDQLRAAGVPVYSLSDRAFAAYAETSHSQGIIAAVSRADADAEDVLAAPEGAPRIVTALWGVTDPGNAGTIIRSCDWFGAPYLLAGGESVDTTNSKTVRASMGSIFRVAIAGIETFDQLTRLARRHGYALIGTSGSEGEDAFRYRYPPRTVLVMGSEAHGLPGIADFDSMVRIPRIGGAESLNVAVSHAIILSRMASPA